ncbi:MAG: branched-chain amino acid transport system II carrier protein [Bacteroidales bacterium]
MKTLKDIWVVGIALFAMIFGAGNLIFPPKLGAMVGQDWPTGIAGFFSTDVGLSLLAIIAAAIAGGSFSSLGNKVHPWFSKVLGIIIVLAVGPLLALPRTGAVTHEMGISPLFPSVSPLVTSILYFGAVIVFVINPGSVVDKIGKILTPFLLLTLFIIIIKGVFFPFSEVSNKGVEHPFGLAFTEGYQTVDGIAAAIFAPIIISALIKKGYKDVKSQIRMTIYSGILAMSVIGLVYGGLIYLGAQGANVFDADINRTDLFVGIVDQILGDSGIIVMSLCVILACFTTAVGLATTTGDYFAEISNGKLPYRWVAITTVVISFFIANLGVNSLVKYSGPILMLFYPVTIVLIILNLIDRIIPGKAVYRGAVLAAFLIELPEAITSFGVHSKFLNDFVSSIPFAANKLEWIIPSIIGGIIGLFVHYLYSMRADRIKVDNILSD